MTKKYACFICRKCYKRPMPQLSYNRFMTSIAQKKKQEKVDNEAKAMEYKCPDCGGQTHYMGTDFKAPKISDIKGWNQANSFIESGKIFYRGSQDME